MINSFQVDWDGYTIGYYGRIFEARNKTKGGSFEVCTAFSLLFGHFLIGCNTVIWLINVQGNEKDFFKFRVGGEEVRIYSCGLVTSFSI